MQKRRIRTLAATGITIMAAALITLSTTAAASAATTTASAPGHVAAPRAAEAPTGCVTETFSLGDQNTYERCVRDEQVLFNDIWSVGKANVNQHLTVDGYYGPQTFSVVVGFQEFERLSTDGITGPKTWFALCVVDWDLGFVGAYWHDAGCLTEPGIFL